MSKYNEFTPTEVGLSKTSWNWFPCQLEPDGPVHYANNHIIMTKPPIRDFPTACPAALQWHPDRAAAFDKPMEASRLAPQFQATDWPRFVLDSLTKRISRIDRDYDYVAGFAILKNGDQEAVIGRHYLALLKKVYGKYAELEFYQEKPLTVVQVRLDGEVVALVMPIDRKRAEASA